MCCLNMYHVLHMRVVPRNRSPTTQATVLRTFSSCLQGQHDVPFHEGASTVSGTLYLSGEEHCRLLNDVYTRFSHTNPMHADVFPSIRQMELEVLAMTASMVGGAPHILSASSSMEL